MTGATRGPGAQTEILAAVRRLREVQEEVYERRREMTGRGLTDSRALDLIREAESEGQPLTPKQLSLLLRISTASTTILLDRLGKDGLVERRPHATDRRSLTVHLVGDIDTHSDPLEDAVRHSTGALSSEEAAAVSTFVANLTRHLETTYL